MFPSSTNGAYELVIEKDGGTNNEELIGQPWWLSGLVLPMSSFLPGACFFLCLSLSLSLSLRL